MHAYHFQLAVVLLLYLATFAAYALPATLSAAARTLRRPGLDATLFLLLSLLAALYAYPLRAEKGGGGPTNPPPRGVIRIYHLDASGRLVPLGASIQEVKP